MTMKIPRRPPVAKAGQEGRAEPAVGRPAPMQRPELPERAARPEAVGPPEKVERPARWERAARPEGAVWRVLSAQAERLEATQAMEAALRVLLVRTQAMAACS